MTAAPLPAPRRKTHRSDRFFDLSLDLMCVVGFDGYFKQVNPTWTHLLGWEEAELVDHPAFNIVHPDDHATLQSARAVVRDGGDPGRIEIRYLHKNGSHRWIWWNVFPSPEEQVIYAIGRDITEQKRGEALDSGRKEILEMIAMGWPLKEILNALLIMLEQHSPDMKCSILLLDEDGEHLRHGAAPSLPVEYCRAMDGIAIGARAGSCGAAAFRREAVIVEDIARDPLWKDYRMLALPHGLRACWSTPVFDSSYRVLGTFAVYYNRVGTPLARHQQLIDIATQLAAIAITRHRDEMAVRRSEEKFTTLFRNAPVMMAISDMRDGTYVDANDYALRLAGFRREEVIGHSAAELGWLKPSDRQLLLDEIASHGRIRGLEMTFHDRNGRTLHGLVTGTQVVINGRPCLLTVTADITERKRTEIALRDREHYLDKIINNVGDPLFVKDERHRFVLANNAFCALFGLPRNKIIGELLDEQTPPEQREHFWRIDRQVLEDGRDNVCEEALTIRGGETRIISTRKTRYVDESGHRFVIGVIRDMTERKRLEEQLFQSQKMEAVGTLAGGIAHDFNNILAAIKGYTQLARDDISHLPVVQEYLDAVLKGARRAAELVKQITTFSRQQDTQQLPVSLPHIVNEAMVLLRATIPSTIEIRTACDDNAPAILADPTHMHQIIMNLCTNAWQAMKSAPGMIAIRVDAVHLNDAFVRLHPELTAGDHVRLSVTDNGCGMDAATQSRIFEPFFTTKAPGEGSGLGLSVVHGIVRAHHGSIVVKSMLGFGTTFELYFPALANGTVAKPAIETSGYDEVPAGNGERILLVDDEPALVEIGSTVLERYGYSVKAFSSSKDALAWALTAPDDFDLVISDLAMPGMPGLDFVEQLQRLRPDVPVIIISGYVDGPTQERIAAMGIRQVLLKPFNINSIVAAAHEVLTTRNASRNA
ncbi:MAG TPA: PAS domain S-box protein [Steroidobacteraceae bacterium]|nr:PAS domain S-box protein [Steroidobacteraceae bacterium]